MAKKIRKITHTRYVFRGKDKKDRLEKAYADFTSGKLVELKKLADKYHLHVTDISRYITMQFQLNKKNNPNE